MIKLYAENILIGSQWQSDKTLSVEDDGTIISIDAGKDSQARLLKGAVIPGMVNCHSHAFQRAFAGLSEYRGTSADSFWSWRDIMYRFVTKMTPEDAHDVAEFLYIEMLKAGYTSVAEFHYLHHQSDGQKYADPAEMSHQIINAAASSGIALTHLPVLYTYAGFGKKPASSGQARFIHSTDDYLKLIDSINTNYTNQVNFELGIAPHSLRAVSHEQLTEITNYMAKLNPKAPVHIHISEQLQEVNDSIEFYKARPVEWLLSNFEVADNWCLIHATHLSEKEVSDLAKSSSIVGICPTTEANLGDGIFPTQPFLNQGGNFAIGSDSHINVNVAEELSLLEYAQRLTTHQRAVLVAPDCPSVGQNLYSKAAKDGAKTVNQNVGEIAVGKRADLVVLDAEHPSLYLKQDSKILDAAIFATNELPVKDVFVAGKQVVESGRHLKQDASTYSYKKVLKGLVQD